MNDPDGDSSRSFNVNSNFYFITSTRKCNRFSLLLIIQSITPSDWRMKPNLTTVSMRTNESKIYISSRREHETIDLN